MVEVKDFEKRFRFLEDEFNKWKPHYIEIAELLLPRKTAFLERSEKHNDGSKVHEKIIDGTGTRALRTMAAGMQSGLTSPARPWFQLTVSDPNLAQEEPVKYWLEDVRRLMLRIFQRSNFYTTTHNMYYEMGAFGTAAMAIEFDYNNIIRCYPFTIGEYYISTDSQHRVNALYRSFWSTVRNVVDRYGFQNCSTSTRNMYKNGNTDIWIRLIHVVEGNSSPQIDSPLARHKPFTSVTYEHANNNGKFLRISGYNTFPVMAPRWQIDGTNVYGSSPGMEALADIKMLQELQKKGLKALDKFIDPPMNAPLSLKSKGTNILPGGVNYVDINAGQQGFTPAYQISPDLASLEYKIERVQEMISKDFFADLFLMIANAPKTMTATEVVERHEEKLLMLGPVIERIQPELLDMVIDRTFDIMSRHNLIPPPPKELDQGMPIDIQYISLLAQAQRMVGISAIEQTAAFAGNLAAVSPDVLDKFDHDEALEQYADMVGIPPKIIVPDKKAAIIRAQRQQQIEQQKQMENAERLAQGAKTLSETDTGKNSALTALMGNQATPGLPQQG